MELGCLDGGDKEDGHQLPTIRNGVTGASGGSRARSQHPLPPAPCDEWRSGLSSTPASTPGGRRPRLYLPPQPKPEAGEVVDSTRELGDLSATVDNLGCVNFVSKKSPSPLPLTNKPILTVQPPPPAEVRSRDKIHLHELEIGGQIGRGSYGKVYRVTRNGQTYALKEINLYSMSSDKSDKMIRAELKQLRTTVETMVTTLAAYYTRRRGHLKLLMEYMPYGTLDRCVKQLKEKGLSLPLRDIALVAYAVSHALSFLRGKHIVHRDMKPSNILIGQNGEVKLSDFGISCRTDLNSQADSMTGTIRWMAPEVLAGEKYTYSVDVYGMGLTVGWLLLGDYPLPHTSDPMSCPLPPEGGIDVGPTRYTAEEQRVWDVLREFTRCTTSCRPENRITAAQALGMVKGEVHSWYLSCLPYLTPLEHGDAKQDFSMSSVAMVVAAATAMMVVSTTDDEKSAADGNSSSEEVPTELSETPAYTWLTPTTALMGLLVVSIITVTLLWYSTGRADVLWGALAPLIFIGARAMKEAPWLSHPDDARVELLEFDGDNQDLPVDL